ncbi:unnamed protein product [Closterium sp. NIES-54]
MRAAAWRWGQQGALTAALLAAVAVAGCVAFLHLAWHRRMDGLLQVWPLPSTSPAAGMAPPFLLPTGGMAPPFLLPAAGMAPPFLLPAASNLLEGPSPHTHSSHVSFPTSPRIAAWTLFCGYDALHCLNRLNLSFYTLLSSGLSAPRLAPPHGRAAPSKGPLFLPAPSKAPPFTHAPPTWPSSTAACSPCWRYGPSLAPQVWRLADTHSHLLALFPTSPHPAAWMRCCSLFLPSLLSLVKRCYSDRHHILPSPHPPSCAPNPLSLPTCPHPSPPVPIRPSPPVHQQLQALQPFGLAGASLASSALTGGIQASAAALTSAAMAGDMQTGFLQASAIQGAALQSFRSGSKGGGDSSSSTNSDNISSTHTRQMIVRLTTFSSTHTRQVLGG